MNFVSNRLSGWWSSFRAATGGASAVEFALTAPFFCALLLGVADIGQVLWYKS
jgi:Flp pilus assembly protein TadG